MDFSGLIASYRPPSAIEKDSQRMNELQERSQSKEHVNAKCDEKRNVILRHSKSYPIVQEVYETMHRRQRARRLQRHAADCIVFQRSPEEIEELLVSDEVDVNESVSKGLRLLHFAVFQNSIEIVNLLLLHGADPNVMDEVGFTPLHLCAERGYIDIIRILLHFGARISFTDIQPGDKEFGDPPRATAADEPLRLAIRNEEHETVLFLLQHGSNPRAIYYLGSEINLVDPMDLTSVEMLLKFGADPNSLDRQGMTPLMKACRNAEAIETVYALISYGADVNAETHDERRTALHYAVMTGNMEIVKMLVENGARVKFPAEYTKPPPHYFAVLRGNVEILTYLLDSGADVNVGSPAVGSALHIAVTEKINNKVAVVRTLLERGANPNAITMSSKGPMLKTPLGEYFHSCEQPQHEVVRLLLRYGARVVLQGQRQHPFGIIKTIHRLHLGLIPEVMTLIVEAAEKFLVSFIEQSKQMSDEHKELLLQRALQPFPLQHIARIKLRQTMGWGPRFVATVCTLPIPVSLKRYLLFEAD